MKHLSLATRYRPQRFDEVAGQDLIKAVLSRASAEDRVASGYLLSGTRGVGKTTVARIFAKALNCAHAPCAEPCGQCEQCRRITAGTHPDVVELDGASNNSVEDARALRETVGFAPMEGRYKIFIIDEAHMLSRNAFNALLKTLEEPPPQVVFIFATTEIFRFPATILSRCQVFSFHHLPEEVITGHLAKILTKEGTDFEEGALRLIARRAAGSARDSMSLLDQILAYDAGRLTAETVRRVLGLAGMDALAELFSALAAGDCGRAALFTRNLVSREIDIGFFLRELTDQLRSLFLLGQCGRDSVKALGVPDQELDFLEETLRGFTPAWIHAAWQMVLESQRGIATSQEPAAALELLLVNLALLPRLLPASLVSTPGSPPAPTPGQAPDRSAVRPPAQAPTQTSGQSSGQSSGQKQAPPAAPGQSAPEARTLPAAQPPQAPETGSRPRQSRPDAGKPRAARKQEAPRAETGPGPQAGKESAAPPSGAAAGEASSGPQVPRRKAPRTQPEESPPRPEDSRPEQAPPAPEAPKPEAAASGKPETPAAPDGAPASGEALSPGLWDSFRAHLQTHPSPEVPSHAQLHGLRCTAVQGDRLLLEGDSSQQIAALNRNLAGLTAALSAFAGRPLRIEAGLSENARAQAEARRSQPALDRPEFRNLFELLDARVDRVLR